MLFRAFPYLLAAASSMLDIDNWLSVMWGPDCWDYSMEELGLFLSSKEALVDERYGTMGGTGQRFGIDPALLVQEGQPPIVQSLRYAVSGVGVNILFLALLMIYLAWFVPNLDRRPPFALLCLDLLTLANATGTFHSATAGHPRCLEESTTFGECAKALGAFFPVMAIDALWLVVVSIVPSSSSSSTTTTSTLLSSSKKKH